MQNEIMMEHIVNKRTLRHPHEPVKVLIVDDDVDAILPVEALFRGLGCATSIAMASKEAHHDVASGLYDIIILDWYMDTTTGAMIMEQALKTINRFDDHRYFKRGVKPRVLTYSALKESQVWLPSNPIFVHEAHWRKPVLTSSLRGEAYRIVHELEWLKNQE